MDRSRTSAAGSPPAAASRAPRLSRKSWRKASAVSSEKSTGPTAAIWSRSTWVAGSRATVAPVASDGLARGGLELGGVGDGGPVGARPVAPGLPEIEDGVGVGAPGRDQGLGAGEVVVAGDGVGVDGEDDDLHPGREPLELPGELGVDGDEEGGEDGLDGTAVAVRCVAQGTAQEDEDPLGPLGDGPADGDVVDHAAVDEGLGADLDGGEQRRQGAGGQDGLEGRSVGEPLGAAVGEGGGHHLQVDGGVLEALEGESLLDETAQPVVVVDGLALLEEADGGGDPALGEDVGAGGGAPQVGHALDPGRGGVAGEAGGVDGSHRGPVDV